MDCFATGMKFATAAPVLAGSQPVTRCPAMNPPIDATHAWKTLTAMTVFIATGRNTVQMEPVRPANGRALQTSAAMSCKILARPAQQTPSVTTEFSATGSNIAMRKADHVLRREVRAPPAKFARKPLAA